MVRRHSMTLKMAVGATALLLMALLATPVAAEGSLATTGTFSAFDPGGPYTDISGSARMKRTEDKTTVTVKVKGLDPGEVYGSHVHKQRCEDGEAGGHYQFEQVVPSAPQVDGKSEIWPGPFTADEDGEATAKTVVDARAGDDAVSVVIHAPTGAKIACADLD